jgi:hypothetical protein
VREASSVPCPCRANPSGYKSSAQNSVGKVGMECVIETKASTVLQFIDGLRGDLHVTLEEGTWAAWLYDLLKPHVTESPPVRRSVR